MLKTIKALGIWNITIIIKTAVSEFIVLAAVAFLRMRRVLRNALVGTKNQSHIIYDDIEKEG